MKTYVVGGAVRDALLGLPVKDRDHVVVGATPGDMLKAGFRPVGADFPVFLHPETQEEYALARTERKTAPGYKGFVFHASPEVTLEEDLQRRDLTINAIARADDGTLVDPCGGQRDLEARVLRHVSSAFREDPVRILRSARFAARFAALGFSIAPETMALMREMVDAGEVDALVPERVWQELARGLMEATPSRMLEVLEQCGALQKLLPEVAGNDHARASVDAAAACEYSQCIRYATLFLAAPGTPARDADAASARLKAPADCRDLAVLATRHLADAHRADTLDAEQLLKLLDATDALRRPARFHELLQVAQAEQLVLHGKSAVPSQAQARLEQALYCLQSIDYGQVAVRGGDIPGNIRSSKLQALHQLIQEK